MKILIDMNLSPRWVVLLTNAGHEAVHWSNVGAPDATDHEIMAWARTNTFMVLTHDLDFGAILASTDAHSPSVFQVRTQNISPQHLGNLIISALQQFEQILKQGALISLDENRARARILPLNREK
ncbi:MAG: DUF5615 family PIN-like protein [Thermodesulfobacteriota bacterium]